MAADFAPAVASYLEEIRARRYSPITQTGSARVLSLLGTLLRERGVLDLHAITEEHLTAYLAHRRLPLAMATHHRHLSIIRSFFSFLMKQGLILTNPTAHVTLPRVLRLPRRVVSLRDAERLMNAPGRFATLAWRDRAILEVLYGTGLRLSECVRLDLADVSSGRIFVRSGKGKKDRVVPLAGRAARALSEYLRHARGKLQRHHQDPALFLSRVGRRLAAMTVRGRVRRYGRAIGVCASAQSLRHACATHLLKGGADVRQVQALLGHKDIATTAIYTRVGIEDLKKAVARAHPREWASR